MEQKLAARQMEMQRLATDVAFTGTSLSQELAAALQELGRFHAQFGAITFERRQQMRTLLEKITKMEADLKDSEHVKAELQHAHAEAQNLVVDIQELLSGIEHLSQEFQRSHVDLHQISVIKSELEALKQEYQHWRDTYEYEIKLRSDHYGSLLEAANHFNSMVKEVEKLRAAVLNATNIGPSDGQPEANAASYDGTEPTRNHPAGQNAYGTTWKPYPDWNAGTWSHAGSALGSAPSSSSHIAYDAPRVATGCDAPREGASVPQGVIDTGNSTTLYVQAQTYGSGGAPPTLGSTQEIIYGSGQAPEAYGSTQQMTYGSGQTATYGSALESGENPKQISASNESTQQPINEYGQTSISMGDGCKS